MTAPTLRLYQTQAIDRLRAAFAAQRKAALLVAPTGSGKTVIMAAIIESATRLGNRVLVIVPRRELVNQTVDKLKDVGVTCGTILAGDSRHNAYALVQVASVDSLRGRIDRLDLNPQLLIVDEAHLFVTEIRVKLLRRWPNARLIGFTATPCRKDGRGLRVLFDTLIEVSNVAELTRLGFLVSARYFSVSEPDMARVAIVAGDYHQGQAAKAMAPLLGDIVATFLERAGGRRTAVFCMTVAHSVSLCALFAEAGVAAEQVDGNTPLDQRAAIVERFTSGKTQVLCNVLVASIGFDLPALDCIQLARPTKSLAMYLQMIGRGLRPSPGKADCLILDHSGTVHRLGFAADERSWSLDGHGDLTAARVARERKEGADVTCPMCSCVYSGGRRCPECGHYIQPRGQMVETLDGDLVEVGAALNDDDQSRLAFYLELRGFAAERGYKAGFALHKYREKHGAFPPRQWNDLPAARPCLATRRWVTSRQIAWAKSRGPEHV